jgi:hypothetical protein
VPEAPANLKHATFSTLTNDWKNVDSSKPSIEVQFNPETLKLSYANQLVEPSSGGSKKGPASRQFLGAGTTKLSLTLWFDITAPPYAGHGITDVRSLTSKISYFVTPTPSTLANSQDYTQFHPSPARFQWGTFIFDGLMDSLEESIEFFGADGSALRASLAVSMSRQKTTPVSNTKASGAGSGGGVPTGRSGQPPGTAPLTSAPAGASLQQLADQQGVGANWQSIAAANGIENPRLLGAGQMIDLGARVSVGLGVSAPLGFTASVTVGAGAGAGASAGIGASAGAAASVADAASLSGGG